MPDNVGKAIVYAYTTGTLERRYLIATKILLSMTITITSGVSSMGIKAISKLSIVKKLTGKSESLK